MDRNRVMTILAVASVVVLAAWIVHLRSRPGPGSRPDTGGMVVSDVVDTKREISGVMGTDVTLIAVGAEEDVDQAVAAAEAELRRVEALMSVQLENSQLALLNAASAGEEITLPSELLALLRRSRTLAKETDGAFDVTCLPLSRAWMAAGKTGNLPTDAALAEAMRRTGWTRFVFSGRSVTKLADGAAVDLGGIAKGYGIDCAIAAMRRAGAAGGLVDAGGDVRCFGEPIRYKLWRVGVQNPVRSRVRPLLLRLSLTNKAVATSGDYQRFETINGRRYSHIKDPRTGRSVEGASSVTVIADDATTADAWATALSVLGPDGLSLVKARGMEAMMVHNGPDGPKVHATDGFAAYVDGPWPIKPPQLGSK